MKNNGRSSVLIGVLVFVTGVVIALGSCTHPSWVMPVEQRTNDPEICFERDILPIFISNCTQSGCHSASSGEKGYVLDNYNHIMNKGIVPGNVAASKIWESIAITKSGEGKMPANGASLSTTQLDLIKRWIAAGAVDSGACSSICDSNNYSFASGVQPLMQKYCTGCHSSAGSPGGSLMNFTSIREAAVNGRLVGDIKHLTGYNAMPQGGYKLTDCQVAQVTKWVAAGALNN